MQQQVKLMLRLALTFCHLAMADILLSQTNHQPPAPKKILLIITSHDKLGNLGQKTGYFLSEVAHPWAVLHDAGYEIDFVSPKGGNPPVDAFNLDDSINKRFWNNQTAHQKLTHSLTPKQINAANYRAVFYAGGHGAMWDFPDNKVLSQIAARIYEEGGIVGAVCHGPAALINVKLSNGHYLVEGKKITGFTNEEEKAKQLDGVVPFLLETKLKQRGGSFEKSDPFKPHVAKDTRLITGQNPASATPVAEVILQTLKELEHQ